MICNKCGMENLGCMNYCGGCGTYLHEQDYLELIMAVARKHPGETRHQTALRYIQEAEKAPSGAVAACAHTRVGYGGGTWPTCNDCGERVRFTQ